ncbi:MAG TPA: S8 family serine peptidase [Thermoanaerobaculia bacterium]
MDVTAAGFELKVGVPGLSGAAAHALAADVVRRHLPGEWRLEVSLLDDRLFEVRPVGPPPTVADSWDLARAMAADRDVVYAEPLLETPGLSPDTPAEAAARAATERGSGGATATEPDANWHIAHCGIDAAWALSRGDGVVIGHPDTGYLQHSEIWKDGPVNRVLSDFGFNFVEPEGRDALSPRSTHGTATASVIMSDGDATDGKIHVSGVAPRARLIPIRVDNDVLHFSWGRVRKAVDWAVRRDCHVISMSLGGPITGPSLRESIQRAVERGTIVVAAAGNIWPFVAYPGRYQEVLCVAASNERRQKWGDSARGEDVDVTAPGEFVWRATVENGVNTVLPSSGTSYATAIVAGIAALWLARHERQRLIERYGAPNIAAVFKEIVMKHGVDKPPGWDTKRMGAGIINAKKVLEAPLPATVPARGVTSVRTATAPPVQTDFDDIAHYFPDVPRERVRANLVDLLGTTDAALDAELARLGEELKLHAAINPQMRARRSGAPAEAVDRGGGVAVTRDAIESQLMLSSGLRARMAG